MALRDLLRLRRTKILPLDSLPDSADFDYKEDHEYVVVPVGHVARYRQEGFVSVAQNQTNHDGAMIILERKR